MMSSSSSSTSSSSYGTGVQPPPPAKKKRKQRKAAKKLPVIVEDLTSSDTNFSSDGSAWAPPVKSPKRGKLLPLLEAPVDKLKPVKKAVNSGDTVKMKNPDKVGKSKYNPQFTSVPAADLQRPSDPFCGFPRDLSMFCGSRARLEIAYKIKVLEMQVRTDITIEEKIQYKKDLHDALLMAEFGKLHLSTDEESDEESYGLYPEDFESSLSVLELVALKEEDLRKTRADEAAAPDCSLDTVVTLEDFDDAGPGTIPVWSPRPMRSPQFDFGHWRKKKVRESCILSANARDYQKEVYRNLREVLLQPQHVRAMSDEDLGSLKSQIFWERIKELKTQVEPNWPVEILLQAGFGNYTVAKGNNDDDDDLMVRPPKGKRETFELPTSDWESLTEPDSDSSYEHLVRDVNHEYNRNNERFTMKGLRSFVQVARNVLGRPTRKTEFDRITTTRYFRSRQRNHKQLFCCYLKWMEQEERGDVASDDGDSVWEDVTEESDGEECATGPVLRFSILEPVPTSDNRSESGKRLTRKTKGKRKHDNDNWTDEDNSKSPEIARSELSYFDDSKQSDRRYPKRDVPVIQYKEPELPPLDHTLLCDECNVEYEADCPLHGPMQRMEDTPVPFTEDPNRARLTVPRAVAVTLSKIKGAMNGICTLVEIPKGVVFGPYAGQRVHQPNNDGYCFKIRCDKGVLWLDAQDSARANWLRYVNCARDASEQNLVAFQYKGEIYFRTNTRISPQKELLVYYGDEYAKQLGVNVANYRKAGYKADFADDIPSPYKPSHFTLSEVHEAMGKRFVGEDSQIKHAEGKPCMCDVCNKRFTQKSDLTQHMSEHTGEKPHGCDVCNKRFNQKNHLTEHIRVHTGEKQYACDVCNKRFTQKSDLTKHIRVHTGEKPYACDVCNKRFTQKSDLTKHIRVHTGEKPYACDVCNKRFNHKISLSQHMSEHTGEKPHGCDVCNKRFNQKNHLTEHIRVHTGEKPHGCDVCNKRFNQKNHLTEHIRVHTGEKPYACDVCNKRFNHKISLTQHIRVHTGEKPYACDVCNKRFNQKNHLTEHIRVHTREKPYACDVCNERFNHKSNLTKHIRVHTGEKPYACDVCNERFTQKSKLTKHIRVAIHM